MSTVKLSVTDGTYTSGMNGVRLFNAGATFDNIQINPLAFSDDLSSGTMGKWTTVDEDLIYEADISINASTANGNGGFIFRVSNAKPGADSYNGYFAGIGPGLVVLGRADNKWIGHRHRNPTLLSS